MMAWWWGGGGWDGDVDGVVVGVVGLKGGMQCTP